MTLPLTVAMLSACALAADPPPKLRRPVESRLLQSTGFDAPLQVVITDATAWREAWSRLVTNRRPEPPLPEVDFSKELVILVAMGRRPSAGHTVKIVSVDQKAGSVLVHAVAVEPGKGCITMTSITAPADLVVLPRSAHPITFDLQRETRDCN